MLAFTGDANLGLLLLDSFDRSTWRGPTIREIAHAADVGSATVDRVVNNRPGVRQKTRRRVQEALGKLLNEKATELTRADIQLFCESGATFNAAVADAANDVNRSVPSVRICGSFFTTSAVDLSSFSRSMREKGQAADGVIVVAREHPAVNSAVRMLVGKGVPVVCFTTDLPSSRRSAYVGNDQHAAGSIAGLLIGKALPASDSRILLVASASFRCQLEREMGFRWTLRSNFPHLTIDERVISDELPATTREQILRYCAANGPPVAIYNVAGANRGVAAALEQAGKAQETLFVGHELTQRSRELLESGTMDYVISHDFAGEIAYAVRWIRENRDGVLVKPSHSPILLHTKYNCS